VVKRKDNSTDDCRVVVGEDGTVESCECLEWHARILCRHMLFVAWTLTERLVAKGNKIEFTTKVSCHVLRFSNRLSLFGTSPPSSIKC
jgi:hypothetical protein